MGANTRSCVLIPYYNAGAELLRSIESIDCDVYMPDVVIVDDGSQTKASEILKAYHGDLVVHLVELAENQGIEGALNAGLEFSLGRFDYIFRLDCGDTCKNRRIFRQHKYLDEHRDVFLLGGFADYVSADGDFLFTSRVPTDYEKIRKRMYLNSMFIHPAVVFRSAAISDVGVYSLDFPAAEDYELFFRIIRKYRAGNLPVSLIDYVVDPNSISSKKRYLQIKSRMRIIIKYFYPGVYPAYGLFRSALLAIFPRSLVITLRNWLQPFGRAQ